MRSLEQLGCFRN